MREGARCVSSLRVIRVGSAAPSKVLRLHSHDLRRVLAVLLTLVNR